MPFRQRNLLSLFERRLDELDDILAAMVLEPIQFVIDAEFAAEVRGRNTATNTGVFWSVRWISSRKVHTRPDAIIEPHVGLAS